MIFQNCTIIKKLSKVNILLKMTFSGKQELSIHNREYHHQILLFTKRIDHSREDTMIN